MALIFFEGFEHYGTGATGRSNMLKGEYSSVTASTTTPSSTRARTGSVSLETTAANSGFLRRFFASKTRAGVGFNYWVTALPSVDDAVLLGQFLDSGSAAQVSFTLQSNGAIRAFLGGVAGTVLGTSAASVIVAGTWKHIEFAVTINNSTGAVEVRVNEVAVLTLSNIDTQASGVTETDRFQYGIGGGASADGFPHYLDDLFSWDNSGASSNTFLGKCRVHAMWPNADTAVAEWTPTGAAAHYDCVNESPPPDSDTTYINAASAVLTDELDLTNAPASIGSILGLQATMFAYKTAADAVGLQSSILSGASATAGSNRNITTAYTYWRDNYHTDPATGVAWTSSGYNSAKLRIQRTA